MRLGIRRFNITGSFGYWLRVAKTNVFVKRPHVSPNEIPVLALLVGTHVGSTRAFSVIHR